MNLNAITNEYDLNIGEAMLMNRLNEKTQVGNPTSVETQFGDIEIRKTITGFYSASICNTEIVDVVFETSASEAFLKLAKKLKGGN